MTGCGIDRRGPKDSENAHNSFLTKSTEKGFWRFAVDMAYQNKFYIKLIIPKYDDELKMSSLNDRHCFNLGRFSPHNKHS